LVLLAYVAGTDSGLGLNTAHELGHKHNRLEQWLARLALAVPAYGHFTVEHGRGHHRWVATPEDHASCAHGRVDLPLCAARTARRHPPRLGAGVAAPVSQGCSRWSWRNTMLQSYAVTAAAAGALIAFGWVMLPFLAIHNLVAWWQLTSANYVEHYGLLRQAPRWTATRRPQPHHSWNANHLVTNLATFHLQRHSDHHANPSRRYQCLRHFADLPQLPSGYFGMFAAGLLARCGSA
jgi:alkane 1-monooxygenase